MVDISDLQKAMMLSSEKQTIAMALEQLDRDGIILSMSIGPKPAPGQPSFPGMGGIQVDTSRMDYPAQMVEAIKGNLHQRQDEIEQELQGLGVTGVEQGRR